VSYLHRRLGGQEQPDRSRDLQPRPAALQTPKTARQPRAGEFRTIRCRSEVTQLHAVNLVADIADAAGRFSVVIVDLSLTARVDAAGLGALVSGALRCREAGSGLYIVGAHGLVAQALRFTGLAGALSMHETVEDALRAM